MKNCRGDDTKLEICKEYEIKPIAFTKILNNQSKQGCCGPLTDRYYIFSYIEKSIQSSLPEYFFVGEHCADEFLKILGSKPLPFFNPLKQEGSSNRRNNELSLSPKHHIHPMNDELVSAINLLCISWNIIPKSKLISILEFTRSRPSIPNIQGVVWLNEIIAKDSKERTLKQMITDLSVNNNIRDFDFSELNALIDSRNLTNRIR